MRVPHSGRLAILSAFILLAATRVQALQDIPDPDLSYLEPQVQQRLTGARSALLAALDDSTTTPAERANIYGKTGEIFQAAGVAEVAAACYANAIELDPDNARWHHLAGWLAQQGSDLQGARNEFTRARDLEPKNPWHALRLALIDIELDDLDQAKALLEPLTQTEGMEVAVQAGLARIASAQGRSEQAIDHYQRALSLQPDANQLRYPLAVELRRAGRLDEAQAVAAEAGRNKVRDEDPILAEMEELSESSSTYTSLAIRAIRSGHLNAAATALDTALELDDSNNRARLNLGVVQMQLGHLDQAQALIEEALKRDPDYAYAHFNLAQLLEKKGDVDGARREYAAALEGDPKSVKMNFRYATLLTRLGEYEPAVSHYRTVVERAPAFVQARYLEALALAALARYDEAREALETASTLAPDRADLQIALARVIAVTPDASQEDRNRALQAATRLYQVEKSTDTAETLAMSLAAVGRFDEAIQLQQAVISASETQAPPGLLTHLRHNLSRYQGGEIADQPWWMHSDG